MGKQTTWRKQNHFWDPVLRPRRSGRLACTAGGGRPAAARKSAASKSGLFSLPGDILEQIVKALPLPDLGSLMLTCRRLVPIASAPHLPQHQRRFRSLNAQWGVRSNAEAFALLRDPKLVPLLRHTTTAELGGPGLFDTELANALNFLSRQAPQMEKLRCRFATLDMATVWHLGAIRLGQRLERLKLIESAVSEQALSVLGQAIGMPRLTALSLTLPTGSTVDALGLLTASKLGRQLRKLKLEGARPPRLKLSQKLTDLQALHLARGDVSGAQLKSWLDEGRLSGLTSLKLNRCSLGDADLQPQKWSWALPNLTQLALENNNLTADFVSALLNFSVSDCLSSLSLQGNSLIDLPAETWGQAQIRLPNLQILDLSHCGLPGDPCLGLPFVEMARHGRWNQLVELDLQRNQLGDAAVLALAAAPWPALVSLDLCANAFSGLGTRAVFAALHMPRLQNLRLCHAENLADMGKGFFRSFRLHGLVSLSLDGNKIDDSGARELAHMICHCPLEFLGLEGNKIGDFGALALIYAPWRWLPTLDLSWNRLGELGVRVCKRALKCCTSDAWFLTRANPGT